MRLISWNHVVCSILLAFLCNFSAAEAPQAIGASSVSIPVSEQVADKVQDAISVKQEAKPTEFQGFAGRSAGRLLPLFGYDFFNANTSTYTAIDALPISNDYQIGPGDEIRVRAWGQIDIDHAGVVDRNGNLFIPKVGNINVAGVKFKDMESRIAVAVGRLYRNFELNVSMGQLRSMKVFVTGFAAKPGTHTISSLSTLVNALFSTGGPSNNGSLRRIQLRRDGRTISEFDVYDLLIYGDKSKDVRLMPGDVLYIPPVGPQVALFGSVQSPAIYELKKNTALAQLIEWSGGLNAVAAGKKLTIERVQNREQRVVEEVSMNGETLENYMLQSGDLVRVYNISPKFENVVTLRGQVAQSQRYPWFEGMRIKDLIPNKEALLTNAYWEGKNNRVGTQVSGATGVRAELNDPEINWEYAVIERFNKQDYSTELISFDLAKAVLLGELEENKLLEPGDIVTIFSESQMRVPVAKQKVFVRLEGELSKPGLYKAEPGETLKGLLRRLGGASPNGYWYGAVFTREATRKDQQKKILDAADRFESEIERSLALNSSGADASEIAGLRADADAQRRLVKKMREIVATGRIVLDLKPTTTSLDDLPDVVLEDGDRLFLPVKPSTVSVVGMVYNENTFFVKEGKTVADYLKQAGGANQYADAKHAYILRADGSIVSRQQSGWLWGAFNSIELTPGDALIIPAKTSNSSLMKDLKDWTSILYQFALGAAALTTLK